MRAARAAAAASGRRRSPNYHQSSPGKFIFNGQSVSPRFIETSSSEEEFTAECIDDYYEDVDKAEPEYSNDMDDLQEQNISQNISRLEISPDLDSFFNRPTPSATNFAIPGIPNLAQIRAERNQLRREFETKPIISFNHTKEKKDRMLENHNSSDTEKIDYSLLQEAFAYTRSLGGEINQRALFAGHKNKNKSVTKNRRYTNSGGKKGRKKAGRKNRRIKGKKGQGMSSTGKRANIRQAKRGTRRNPSGKYGKTPYQLHDRSNSKSTCDFEALQRNFESGEGLARLRAELARSEASRDKSLSFLSQAREQILT